MSELKNKVNEITLERTMCYGSCPVYRVILRKDGNAIYEGKDNVNKLGRFTGILDAYDFERLVELMEKLNFLGMEERYSAPVTDGADIITTVFYDGKVKIVDNYADAGPMEVWAIEKVIDGIIEDIYWEKESC
jgi:hypothetical protein